MYFEKSKTVQSLTKHHEIILKLENNENVRNGINLRVTFPAVIYFK